MTPEAAPPRATTPEPTTEERLAEIRLYARYIQPPTDIPAAARAINELLTEVDRLRALSTGEPSSTNCWGYECETAAAIERALSERGIRTAPDETSEDPDEWARKVIGDVRGEPSPDIAALLDAYVAEMARLTRDVSKVDSVRSARAAVDAHLVSLHARFTAAERDAERMRTELEEANADLDAGEFVGEHAILCRVFDDIDEVYAEWEAYDKSGWLSRARALGAFIRVRLDARAALPPSGDTRGEQP